MTRKRRRASTARTVAAKLTATVAAAALLALGVTACKPTPRTVTGTVVDAECELDIRTSTGVTEVETAPGDCTRYRIGDRYTGKANQ